MERKNVTIVIAVILVLLIAFVGIYFYMQRENDKKDNKPDINDKVEDKEEQPKEETTNLAIDDSHVVALFDNAHYTAIGVDARIFKDGGYRVSEMSEEEKINLLFTQWKKELAYDFNANTGEEIVRLKEETLKNLYEKTFGENTYQSPTKITDGSGCYQLTYDTSNNEYIGKTLGCGGSSNFANYEKIISATKNSKKIEIVSAVFYYDPSGFYKDYDKTIELETNEDILNSYTTEEERKVSLDQFVEQNKDNLEQYTYTYVASENGFYYLSEVKRTKE